MDTFSSIFIHLSLNTVQNHVTTPCMIFFCQCQLLVRFHITRFSFVFSPNIIKSCYWSNFFLCLTLDEKSFVISALVDFKQHFHIFEVPLIALCSDNNKITFRPDSTVNLVKWLGQKFYWITWLIESVIQRKHNFYDTWDTQWPLTMYCGAFCVIYCFIS